MTLFQDALLLNILARIPKSGSGCGCGCFSMLLIAIFLVFMWENFIYFFIAVFLYIVLWYSYYKIRNYVAYKNKVPHEKPFSKTKNKHLSDENRAKIISLAEDYINNLLKNEKKLSAEDYKQFNDIVKIENNIKISTNYAGVHYPIREILYTTYDNKIKDINK